MRVRLLPPRLPWAALLSMSLLGCVTSGTLVSENAVLRAKDKVAPALVHIRPIKEVYSQGRREEMVTIGSGFLISPDGYIVTNEHVAGESNYVHVVLSDKDEVEAKVVGVDQYTDIAVLKLDVDRPLPFVELGSSSDLEAGEAVLALGSPHGLARSVSQGIISVTDRHLEDRGTMVSPFNNWLQTDAAINPGNSGGPLVNLRGEVVGVNARVLTGAENVGFAIPIDVAKEVVAQLIEHGEVRRSNVGMTLQEMLAKTDDPTQEGVIIADVDPLSPASDAQPVPDIALAALAVPPLDPAAAATAAAPEATITPGIQPGDVLVAINSAPVNARFEEDLPAVRKQLADLPIGEPATLTLRRGGDVVNVSVTPEPLTGLKGTEREFKEWAFTASELTPQQVRRARLAARRGVYVSGVQIGGPANEAGLQQGDIILSIDEEEVENLESFVRLYEGKVEARPRLVMLFVKRGAVTRFVLVKQSESPEMPSPMSEAPLEEEGGTANVE